LPVSGRFSAASGLIFTMAERAASSWSAAIVCVCEAERRLALEKRIAPPDRLFVIHNGVRDVPPELRARPERDPVRLCTVARFEPPKDFVTLIEALARLKNLPWTLDIAGDGPLEPQIRRLAGEQGLGGRIRFLGYQPDPAALLASSQLFVLASRSEAFPRSILEAMRAGLPVVATDVGGINEAVICGETGLLASPRDPAALAAAITDLLSDGALRRKFGDRARSVFERSFGLEHTVGKTLALYANVLVRP
jgi:glycosyltransferase involved in cell wall biosynthesis